MKDIIPPPPAPIVHDQSAAIQQLFQQNVIPTYARFPIAFSHGAGSYVWDVTGKRYLDLGGGIAVNALGHAHPAISETLAEQSRRLIHVSNLYYHEPQGRLAEALVQRIGPGKIFFCNSGAEADEGLFKLARRFGHEEGRFEILTAANSFHGRTLAGIAATGQEKFRKGFEPATPGFRHVPYNDLAAVRNAISPATVAVLIEGIQGEGGIQPAQADYLLGLRALCDAKKLLLLMDVVQCGHFRTGRFQSFQRVLEGVPGGREFLPDGIAMAKSLGGGFPLGAFWVREPHADLFGPGSHGTTFGGTPLGCAVALKILEIIDKENLVQNVRDVGDWLKQELSNIASDHPHIVKAVRGLGFMLGIEMGARENVPGFQRSDKNPSIQCVERLHDAGVLTVPSGAQVIRLLPPLNLTRQQAEEGVQAIRRVVQSLNQRPAGA
jgi:acetylornithine/N-succinyldiaminopimelate aminotransferase